MDRMLLFEYAVTYIFPLSLFWKVYHLAWNSKMTYPVSFYCNKCKTVQIVFLFFVLVIRNKCSSLDVPPLIRCYVKHSCLTFPFCQQTQSGDFKKTNLNVSVVIVSVIVSLQPFGFCDGTCPSRVLKLALLRRKRCMWWCFTSRDAATCL